MPKQSLYVVMLVAQSSDHTFRIFTKPLAACRDRSNAKRIAEAEKELNNRIVVEGRECMTISGIFEIPEIDIPRQAKECWIVWSVAIMRDGSGKTMSRLDGVFGREDSAIQKKNTIPQGEQLIEGFPGEIKTQHTKVGLT